MINLAPRMLVGTVLIASSIIPRAVAMDITADFSPSMAAPENNIFTNTTPQSGYCLIVTSEHNECKKHNLFSISMGGITASLATEGFLAYSAPRMGVYFKMPGAWRDTTLINQQDGTQTTVRFRVSGFSAEYNTKNAWTLEDHRTSWLAGSNGWGSFVNAPSPCIYSGAGWYDSDRYNFMWKWPVADAACYKVARKNLVGEPYLINNTSIMYELLTPEPLKLNSGYYTGTLHLAVGPGGDIDFGDNFIPSDTELNINFSLSVNHELKLATTADDQKVSLQPCVSGRVCTEDEGRANWERWMVTRITPQLTGRSHFSLSSSGSFIVYLQCEQQSGPDCALKSDNNPSHSVPVQTLLTLPDNIVDNSTGSTVSKMRLAVGREATTKLFLTKSFGQNKSGSIDFLVDQRGVDTMLETRPDTYRGAVTVIFDPNIY